MEFEGYKQFIDDFSFHDCLHGSQGYSRVLLQLFGYVGHGKSSFINTCKYVFDGEFLVHAELGNQCEGKKNRRSYQLTDSITLVDNRGCPKFDSYVTGEIFAQLGNLLPLNREVHWETNLPDILSKVSDYDHEPNYSDFIVPVFIFSVKYGLRVQNQLYELRELLNNAKKLTGIVPFVVLTHKSQEDLTGVQNMFKNLGIDNIFQLENYTPSDSVKVRATHEEVVKILYEVLKDVNFRMTERRDREAERAARKRSLEEFVRDQQRKEEERRQEPRGPDPRQRKTCYFL
ncbi:uncharacterized protein LOC128501190 [Spea bombifrons]|uniref:uncharacterized protein LOC128501190 n=1 Tax=Spea bombifrons TaxID=233779 RepID=UPI00234AAB1E|nr:uncharacterized protein LOC128501190 [Spea bombifrons]